MRARVQEARERQRVRYAANAASAVTRTCPVRPSASGPAGAGTRRRCCEGRRLHGADRAGFDRALKVARTVADLEGADRVAGEHLLEALSYRALGEDLARAG